MKKVNIQPHLLIVVGLFAIIAFVSIKNDIVTGAPLTSALINISSNKANEGVKYPVTSEYSRQSSKAKSLITYGEPSISNSLQTLTSNNFSPIIQTQDSMQLPQLAPTGSYIVELTEPSLTQKYKEVSGGNTSRNSIAGAKDTLSLQKTKVTSQQTNFISSLPSSVKTKNSSVPSLKTKKFSTVINALVITADKGEIDVISKLPGVKRVQPVQKVKALLMDSVPLINAPQVWSPTATGTPSLTGRGIKIAIIDSGIDYTHPDLGGCLGLQCKVVGGYDFINNDSDPMDDMGHGTHVAAIAGGKGALKGVAPDATLYGYKVLDQDGYGSWETVIAGLERAADPNGDGDLSDHVDIANLSIGGNGNPDDVVSLAVDRLSDMGVVVIVAAGNSGPNENTIGSPGSARKAITVAATDKYDNIAYFSSRGPVTWTDTNGVQKSLSKPDVSAPGVGICAARYGQSFPNGDTNCNDDSNHVSISGTSMAAPHVAGEAALLLQLHRDWTPLEIKMAIRKGTVLPNQLSNYNETTRGRGRIDALKTVGLNKLPIALFEPTIRGSTSLKGTATSLKFSNYKISYGFGSNPTTFSEIYSSNNPVVNNILYTFDANMLNEGMNTIKLSVRDIENNTSEDTALIDINNMEITSVGGNLNYVNGGIKKISGHINLPNIASFRVKLVGPGQPVDGIILCSGKSVIISGIICSPDFSKISNGKYSLILEVLQNGIWKSDIPFDIAVVKELLNNWPQAIGGFPRGIHSVIGSDIIQSVKQLFVLGFSECGIQWCSDPGTISLYNSDGSFTKFRSFTNGTAIPGDGFPSIYYDKAGNKIFFVLTEYRGTKITISDTEGSLLKSILTDTSQDELYSPMNIFDRNDDGLPEIYALQRNYQTGQAKIAGYDFQGDKLENFPLLVPQGNIASRHVSLTRNRVVGTSTPSHNIALVVGNYNVGESGWMEDLKLYMHVFSGNNNLVKSTPIFEGIGRRTQISAPHNVVADLDGDGNTEIIMVYSIVDADLFLQDFSNIDAYTTYIRVFDNMGNIVSSKSIKGYTASYSHLAIGNLGQKNPGIVAVLSDTWPTTERGYKIIAFDSALKTIFEKNEKDLNSRNPLLEGLSIGDVDNDGKSEIILNYRPRLWDGTASGVQILNNDGSMKKDIVLPTLGIVDDFGGSPAILDDFDGNGTMDIILQSHVLKGTSSFGSINITDSSTMLYALNLGGSYGKKLMDWKTILHDNARTGCFNCFGTSSPVVIEPEVDPSASIIGTPTLAMEYDNSGGENVLVSNFKVRVNAGSEDIKISANESSGAFSVYVRTEDGLSSGASTRIYQAIGLEAVDGFYNIDEGESVDFNIQTAFNPKIMFAGTYRGFLEKVTIGDLIETYETVDITPSVPTNSLTIIGEVSPYINSISPSPVPSNHLVTITGVRFAPTGNILKFLNEETLSVISERTVDSMSGGSLIEFIPNVPEGNYYISVTHPVTGASNMVGLRVGSTVVTIDDTSPSIPQSIGWSDPITSTSIPTVWKSSTDNVGVAGYKLYRSVYPTEPAYITTTRDLNYTNTGLTPNTQYSFKVSAIDAAGNESDKVGLVISTLALDKKGTTTPALKKPIILPKVQPKKVIIGPYTFSQTSNIFDSLQPFGY